MKNAIELLQSHYTLRPIPDRFEDGIIVGLFAMGMLVIALLAGVRLMQGTKGFAPKFLFPFCVIIAIIAAGVSSVFTTRPLNEAVTGELVSLYGIGRSTFAVFKVPAGNVAVKVSNLQSPDDLQRVVLYRQE